MDALFPHTTLVLSERKGVELRGPRAGTMRQMGGDPRPREIGEGRGAGDAKAAAERQPRRGMFDGLKLSAEPAKAAEPAQGARSEEHTSELQSLMRISYAVVCLKKKKQQTKLCTNYEYIH